MSLDQVVVVGVSAAGLTAAETLRREGYTARLVLVDGDQRPPYDRPPLSKQLLRGEWEEEKLTLRPPAALEGLDAEWRLGVRAERLDLAAGRLALADGSDIAFDGLVVATGVRPRALPFAVGRPGVHMLRTIEDALALRREVVPGAAVVVVGAGFLGTEAASVAAELGCRVTVIDPLELPLQRQLGPRIGQRVARLHRDHGVQLLCGRGVADVRETDGRVSGVVLDDGAEVAADVLLVAIGAEPVTDWLRGSGLTIDDGVQCDEFCQAAPGVVAAGDVASWLHPTLGRLRLEHRMNATEQGMAAARTLLGKRTPFAPVPYFWSDQYDVRIQVYGRPTAADFTAVEGSLDEGPFAAVQRDASGRTTAVAGWNMPRQLRALRQELVEQQAVRC
ncbi:MULTISPECIES: NAD(P)/FAD-dependent oxidoreductase [Rhodococcus]|uniref:NAD(P)/FAD-dependent oxidoreductase n=1 Tax=Rhodococcus aetherivorans TaxID=191292 RepID=A0AA46PV41_9NOCA|nr:MULTISPECIES: FAD/NAD(P)-binding oxidoreductase [Rhodococcus]AKE88219.1 ferredoxin reductase [Rhodococcus aetherivorans]ANZ27154.1 ferredoxin reductase [Rhodococcus sp. WB1]MBC2592248.1 NAD(P)/FAD-dependent oxidoreductase [Rhodococcus aetherivorans]QIX48492.1 NAD(P)/FAD-dependent oxidoreductase [Rhodococcus sp. DMU1]UGQ40949.1 NAD(P)/FAD-dependent oxidoreductase [Rhodococcus aetherivorans]